MKNIIASLIIAGLGTSLVNAQIFTIDPSVKNDNPDYSALTFSPTLTSPEWESAPDIAGDDWLMEGYAYDIIFLGEDAGFDASDLYFLGDPGGAEATSLAAFTDISSPPLMKGDYVTVTVSDNGDLVDDSYLFDFMLDSDEPHSEDFGFTNMGEFNLFYWANDVGDSGDVAPNGLYNTENYPNGYLVFSFEDLGTPNSDEDFNDLFFAINLNGTQVPEPSTYGIIGALALLGLVISRRFRNKA